ncbi:methyltransferase, FxLD system [Dactylosporangium sp. CA-152071]|uniref:methyltransferase, FxLD system n=1 Tax=Dactylosporangium sp. CA-152071 TaxID=3239933 RepID=UPI003D94C97F
MTTEVAASSAAELRQRLVAQLTADGAITTDAVARAMLAVPRERFTPPGTDLTDVYGAYNAVITKRQPDGRAMSSVSAAWLQARMLEQARIGPGSRVLEIGSGGCNAALIAELVGPTGHVVSLDIDADVVAAAQSALTTAGYPHVQVVHSDGEHGYAADGPYDVVLVTVETSDVPPAWTDQLAAGGRLVAPVRMRAHTRSLTLERDGDLLAATGPFQCGFVPMQGNGRDPIRRIPLRGEDAVLGLDDPTTQIDADALRAALDGPRTDAWSPVMLPMDASFDSLHLWLASQPRPYGIFTVDRQRTAGLLDPQDRFFCPTLLTSDSLAYLAIRRHDEGDLWQCGAHGFGPDAVALTQDLVDLTADWAQHHRTGTGPAITVHPALVALPSTDPDHLRLVVQRRHTRIALTWPGAGR